MKSEVIVIATTRSAYSAQQVIDNYTTMTVGELIKELSQHDSSTPIIFSNDNGYTYGHLYDDFICTTEIDIPVSIEEGDICWLEGDADEIIQDSDYHCRVSSQVEVIEPDESGWVLCNVRNIGGDCNVSLWVDIEALRPY